MVTKRLRTGNMELVDSGSFHIELKTFSDGMMVQEEKSSGMDQSNLIKIMD